MNDHQKYQELLPLYVAHQLSETQRAAIDDHLPGCAECRAEIGLWEQVSSEIYSSSGAVDPPSGLAKNALEQIHLENTNPSSLIFERFGTAFASVFNLLCAQTYLIKREMWPTSAAIMALGVIVALLANRVEAIYFIAPLVAAASLAMLFNPEHDPTYELALATPTSSWKILLARLSVVSAYNLILALLASLMMLLIAPTNLLGVVIMGWLAPMAFLSALALLLAVWIGTSNAIALSYGLWLLQYLQFSKLFEGWRSAAPWDAFLSIYRGFWGSPGLLIILSLVLVGMALFSIERSERMISAPVT